MAFIIFGSKETFINLDAFFIKCPSCETDNWADVMVTSEYYHLYYVPIFPFNKNAHVVCKTCGLKRYGIGFDKKLIKNLEEVKHQYKHPWFTYIGLGLVGLLISFIIISSMLRG
ncbi:MAG: zinc-ribbon domain-containing protein [Flavobacterium sp.]|nr:zinc-ribbon domain-containing protein [Flavobacterium sp.]